MPFFGIKMLGSTLLRWGTAEQRRPVLPRMFLAFGAVLNPRG